VLRRGGSELLFKIKSILPSFSIALALGFSLSGPLRAADPSTGSAPQLPTVTVTGVDGSGEMQPVDNSGRPEWTSERRFGNTRVYIQDSPGDVSLEQWWRMQRGPGKAVENLFEEEVEIGLPYRMQLDLYENWIADQHGRTHHDSVSFELRWAVADWGKIPLNPTLYGEYKVAPTVAESYYELKILLGTDFTKRLHWGFNASREAALGGARSVEYEITQGLSYSVIDQRLGIGVEMEYGDVTLANHRSDHERRFLIGPSIQFRPTKNTHIDIVAEAGVTQSPYFQSFVIFGIDFGRLEGEQHYVPASIRGN